MQSENSRWILIHSLQWCWLHRGEWTLISKNIYIYELLKLIYNNFGHYRINKSIMNNGHATHEAIILGLSLFDYYLFGVTTETPLFCSHLNAHGGSTFLWYLNQIIHFSRECTRWNEPFCCSVNTYRAFPSLFCSHPRVVVIISPSA